MTKYTHHRLYQVTIFLAVLCLNAHSACRHFSLAATGSWEDYSGFFLRFENRSEDGAKCTLATQQLVLGVADGEEWRILRNEGPWLTENVYRIEARIYRDRMTLSVNGGTRVETECRLAPCERGTVTAADAPSWANKGEGDYLVIQRALRLQNPGGDPIAVDMRAASERATPLLLFNPNTRHRVTWSPTPTDEPATVDAEVRIVKRPDPASDGPLVDRYGQLVAATFPGKISTDAQLQDSVKREQEWLAALAAPSATDRYGGRTDLGWQVEATGYYRVHQRNGFWWLVSPEGNPCFYRGVCAIAGLNWPGTPVTGREAMFAELPPRDGEFAKAWHGSAWGKKDRIEYVALHTANMIRKYGNDWENTAMALVQKRLWKWGFTGGGKWPQSVQSPIEGAYIGHLTMKGVPRIGAFPDVFAPEVCARIKTAFSASITPKLNDPRILGWSHGNEKHSMPHPKDILAFLKAEGTSPVKRTLVDHVLNTVYGGDMNRMGTAWKVDAKTVDDVCCAKVTPPKSDIEAMRLFYADRYFKTLYSITKEIDSNHLYFGFWITPGWWVNVNDWHVSATYCDVIGYDHYATEFAVPWLAKLIEKTAKPVLCGEFGAPPSYDGLRGFGQFKVAPETEEEAAQVYHDYVKGAAENPWCVGVMWFILRDQPITGRGPGNGGTAVVYGENYAFGLVNVTDTPKWDMVERIRNVNLAADRWRQTASERIFP